MPDAGFYIFRNGWDSSSTILMLKASPPGEFHAQPDNGTFELWVNGRNFMPDAGSFVYSGDSVIMSKRNWFRQTAVHNTMTLDNQNMLITDAKLNKWSTSKDLDVLTYTNPSYTHLNHQRTVLFVEQKYFLIIDRAIGNKKGMLGIHFHLKEDCQPNFNSSNQSVTTNYTDGNNLLIQCLSSNNSVKKEEGKVSYHYAEELDRPAFAFESVKTERPATIVTIIYPYVGMKAPKIILKENRANSYTDGKIDITLTIDGMKKRLKLSTDK